MKRGAPNAFSNPAGTPDIIGDGGRGHSAGPQQGFSRGASAAGQHKNPGDAVRNSVQREKLFNYRPQMRPESVNDNPRY